ncbi:MAG TPA: helix-turn-helix domain-containing protein [Gammaproteobacteria bacterium]|nr:helix-turn-helix domain-containing protein [Gammaproteobacteria bacterium]
MGLSQEDTELLDQTVNKRRKLARGEHLYRVGDPFQALYAVRSGFFKTLHLGGNGREKIVGFYMPGEVLGMDAISIDRHQYSTMALEDSIVCDIPFAELEHLIGVIPSLQYHFHRLMSGDINAGKRHMLLLDNTRAEERLAGFLLSLSQRFAARGYSPTQFNLRMTREEIGNYLGLTIETISRLFSRLQKEGLVNVQNREVKINDLVKLRGMVGHCD